MSGLNTAEAHAFVAVQSYGGGHSGASMCAQAAAQAQGGGAKVPVWVSNPIMADWHVGPRQEVGVDQWDQPLLYNVEYGGGNAPTGGGASHGPPSPWG